jgi:hypothetical protein
MATITVKTPFKDDPIIAKWDEGKVTITGGKGALLFWDNIKYKGLHGKYGHLIDLKNTLLSDLVIAFQNLVPPQHVSLDKEAIAVRNEEHRREKPIPKDAVS